MRTLLTSRTNDDPCRCRPTVDDDVLVVDADDCPGDGRLARRPACRGTVVDRLTRRDVDRITVRSAGTERVYRDRAAALLVAAGRFVERLDGQDAVLAATARTDPIRAGVQAAGRSPPASTVAAETGLAAVAADVSDYATAPSPFVGLTAGRMRVRERPPTAARRDRRALPTGATATRYAPGASGVGTYHLLPLSSTLDETATRAIAAAREAIADGTVTAGPRGPARAVARVVDDPDRRARLADVLRKHVRGYGLLEDLLADPLVSDVYATAPVADTPLRVVADGESYRTNVRLTPSGAAAFASRLRRDGDRPFSRAAPTVDATATLSCGRPVRVAGVRPPVSDGIAFAVRDGQRSVRTLPGLVANGTLPPAAAAWCSLAVERGAATLVVGGRGAGKTTLLGALCWELEPGVRTVVLEDTPELPVEALQAAGRDVQHLRTTPGGDAGADGSDGGPAGTGVSPTTALRSALRLGEGALVVGEVRGREAPVLYEAMRVGASSDAVLGTVHGDGGEAVRERMVSDLGVPASSFLATDLVVTAATVPVEDADTGADRHGATRHRVTAIEEVVERERPDGTAAVGFEPLFERVDGTLEATGRIDRGNSALVADCTRAGESYADVLAALSDRTDEVARLAREGRTTPADRWSAGR